MLKDIQIQESNTAFVLWPLKMRVGGVGQFSKAFAPIFFPLRVDPILNGLCYVAKLRKEEATEFFSSHCINGARICNCTITLSICKDFLFSRQQIAKFTKIKHG